MANTKISDLPAVTSLGITDVVPVVQAGASKKIPLGLLPRTQDQGRGAQTGLERLRGMVRGGQITAATPFVPIGDSHTDNATNPFMWNRLKQVRNQPGEGFEGVPANAIIPMGNNGQTLANYLAGGGTNTFTQAMALNPSVVFACWLINDVRLGGLGTTVSAIRAAGVALLNQFIANVKAAQPNALIVLRVPETFTTANTTGDNYVSDGTTINAAGIAQIYTTALRATYYDVLNTYPDVLIYDTQSRVFGTTCPTTNTSPFANQIHPDQAGYELEADDFAAWVGGATPYSTAQTNQARAAAISAGTYAPWSIYGRSVEDTDRYGLVASARYLTSARGSQDYLDIYYPAGARNNITYYDLVELPDGQTFRLPNNLNISATGTNTRLLFASGVMPTFTFTDGTVKIWRQKYGEDAIVEGIIRDTSWQYKKLARLTQGNSAVAYLEVQSEWNPAFNGSSTEKANNWARSVQVGDQVYVEGRGANPITLTATNFFAQGSLLILQGLSGFDYSTITGRVPMVAIVGNHLDRLSPAVATKTSNYTLAANDGIVLFNGASLTATLPDPTAYTPGNSFTVKNLNASSLTVVSAGTSKTIDGAASQTLAQWARGTFVTDGTQWLQVS